MNSKHCKTNSSRQRTGKGIWQFLLMILLIGGILVFPTEASAQKTTLRIEQGTLDQAFQQIMKKSNIQLVYNTDAAAKIKCPARSFQQKDIKEILNILLAETSLTWQIKNGIYTIVQKTTTPVQKEDGKVSGIVTDDLGEPIIGASVMLTGTALGVITDIDGHFTLDNLPVQSGNLRISFVGMKTQEVTFKNNAKLKIVLAADNELLDEVVIVAYGPAKKSSFTGSAAVIKKDALEKRQVSNLTNALSGEVSGVQTLSSEGAPGTAAKVRIRGVGSINAGTDPLYVVDGIPFDGDISSLNMTDIESMTVLKDAAAASLYGSRAANGVIIVTTKKGKSGKAQVNFDMKLGINTKALPNYDVIQSPAIYTEKAYQAIYNGYRMNLGYDKESSHLTANQILPTAESGGLGYTIYTVPNGQLLIGSNGKLNPNATLGYSDGTYYYTPDNWRDETYKSNLRQEYNLNVSGAGEKLSYYLSMGYLDDLGLIDNSGLKRYTLRMRGDYELNKYLKMGANLSYAYTDNNYPNGQTSAASSSNAFMMANMLAPVYPMYVRNADGSLKYDNQGKVVYDYGDGNSTHFNRSFSSISNPVGDLLYNTEFYKADIFSANWYATLTPIEGLSVTARYGLNVDNTQSTRAINPFYGQYASVGGYVYQATLRQSGFDQQYIANYYTTLNDVHNLEVLAGYDGYTFKEKSMSAYGQNIYNPNVPTVDNTIDSSRGTGTANTYATVGYLSRVNYNYNETYYASASFRRDGSSRFHPDHRWGNFWSFSGAWMLTKEKFMENLKWIDILKLKASFGQQGNDAIGNEYAYVNQYSMLGSNGSFSDGLLSYKGNPDITWETTNAFNAGLDFTLFGNKLDGTIEYFVRQTKDMLYNKPVSPSAGYGSIPMNVGSMRNSGLEMELKYKLMEKNGITWDVSANATYINNTILKLYKDLHGELISGNFILRENASMYSLYLVDYVGVDPTDGQALYLAKDEKGTEYATNDWQKAASTNRKPTKSLMPKVYGGFGSNFSYKGFDASISFSYQLGGTIYDSGYQQLMHGGMSNTAGTNWHEDILKSWTESNTVTNVPRVDAQDLYTNANSTRFLISSDFLNINNITVGYTLPKALLMKFGIERLRFFCVADNVAMIAARHGLDPRQSYTTTSSSTYSPIRTISGGLNLTF